MNKTSSKERLNVIIILAFMFGFKYIPAIDPITVEGMQVLGIFIACIYGWLIGQVGWVSILALVSMGFVGTNTVMAIFVSFLGNATLHMVIVVLMVCYAMDKSGLLEVIAKKMLSLKIAQKGPWWLAFTFWLATAVSSGVTLATAGVAILFWGIFYGVVDKLGIDKKSNYVKVVIIGICFIGFSGGLLMPYAAFVQICIGVIQSVAPDVTIGVTPYIFLMFVINAVLLIALPLICKYVLRIEADFVIDGDAIGDSNIKMNSDQKWVLGMLAVVCVFLMAPYYTPSSWAITGMLSNLGFTGSFCVMIVVLAIVPSKVNEGEKILDVMASIKEGVPFSLILLVGTALTVSTQLTIATTGISTFLSNIFAPVAALSSPVLALALFLVLTLFLTNLINNVVCASLMIPISITALMSVDVNLAAFGALMCMATYMGIIFPSSSQFGAMLHGNDEWISSADVYKYATIMTLLLAVVMCAVGIPLANILF